jgi:hypothetical protein
MGCGASSPVEKILHSEDFSFWRAARQSAQKRSAG